ncbi:zincin-like metallopeptidase toxin domain-containing protein [Rhizobium leguminosarum]|uniref:zincin-like metallopeptidase toxin domain-containing protein n=2 Tax=Rhizobium TaxID=379 RepID=UPI003D7A4F18
MGDGPVFGGRLYPPERLQSLVGYLERRNVSVFGTEGNPGFMARANGSGQLLLPENPTVLQVKHELSHYLDFKKMGFEAYRDMGRLGREASVLERLQANRSWSAYTDAERRFSIDYVNRLRGQ